MFEESIAIMREVKRAYTVEDVADRATRVIHGLVGHGVTLIRSYVDVDTIVGLPALDGVLAARERCRRLARIELIAFPRKASGATRAPTSLCGARSSAGPTSWAACRTPR